MKTTQPIKVLVSDPLSEVGVKIFEETPEIHVDVNTGLSPEELKEIIPEYHGLVIRSATKVTGEIIQAATRLKVIGRAGIGLDNVDIPGATQRGIVVMNTPEGNTVTTAEHTIAMMLALSRNIPQATAGLKAGKWEKKKLQGREVCNKTLGVIGAGHIGRIVADRARGLKMKVIVHDPYIEPQTLEAMELEPVSFEELLHRADYVTIHTPKNEETANLINRDTLSRMKKGAMLINCARGGIVNEEDLFEALKSGHLAGAAMDVFSKEPPGMIDLMTLANFICTPHLGASTKEAQDHVARDVAEQMAEYLLHGTVKNAVNVPSISEDLMHVLRPYATLAEKMGAFQTQLADGGILEARMDYSGKVAKYDVTPLTTAMLKGLLTPILGDDVNFVNAPYIARERGIKVAESKSETSRDFASLMVLTVKTTEGENSLAGTIFGTKFPRILRINGFYLEAVPEGHNLLLTCTREVPAVVGRAVSLMEKHGIYPVRMQMGRKQGGRENSIFLATDSVLQDDTLKELQDLKGVSSARRIEL